MKSIKRKQIALFLICILALNSCRGPVKGQQQTRYEAQFLDLFDTATTIIGYAKSQEEFEEMIQLVHDKLEAYHQLFDIYNDYPGINNLKTINDNAGKEPVVVDKEIIHLLKLGIEMYGKSGGAINIAYGSVLRIWHDYRQEGISHPQSARLPSQKELLEAEKHTDITKIKLDEEASTVYLEDKEMSLDAGALGKGYGVEAAGEYGIQIGLVNVLYSVGGNVKAVGSRADGTDWLVGIQNPDTNSREAYVKKAALRDKSLVTSGNYQRYYMVDGKRYHHIIDPATRMPGDYYAAVSIIMEDSGMADALSTALYNLPFEEGEKVIKACKGAEAMWIYEDGTIKYTDGFMEYIAD